MGCLFALLAGIFSRLAFFIYWIARPAKVDAAFDTFLLPLLGIIFLPFATLSYVLLYTPGIGLTGMGVVLGRRGRAVRHPPLGRRREPA